MTANSKAKLKTLYVLEMLKEETDSDHGLSMRDILERLAEKGVDAERKSIYRDVELLREFGLDIKTYQRNPLQYGLARRDFDLSELMLIVDAVESCKSLSRRQANVLVGNIKSLASAHQQPLLDRRIHVKGRNRLKDDCEFRDIDLIHEAQRKRKKISFTYLRYGSDGKRHETKGGQRRVVTPLSISYDEGFYYLTSWDDVRKSFREYRIDRMGKIEITDEAFPPASSIPPHSPSDDDAELFGRYSRENDVANVTLAVREEKVEIVMDRFDDRATFLPNSSGDGQWARAYVKVHVSPQFFGWIAGLDGEVSIAEPPSLVKQYQDYLQGLIDGAVGQFDDDSEEN